MANGKAIREPPKDKQDNAFGFFYPYLSAKIPPMTFDPMPNTTLMQHLSKLNSFMKLGNDKTKNAAKK